MIAENRREDPPRARDDREPPFEVIFDEESDRPVREKKRRRDSRRGRLVVAGVALLGCAAGAYGLIRLAEGTEPAGVTARAEADVDPIRLPAPEIRDGGGGFPLGLVHPVTFRPQEEPPKKKPEPPKPKPADPGKQDKGVAEEAGKIKPPAPKKKAHEAMIETWIAEAVKAEERNPERAAELYARVARAAPERTALWRVIGGLWLRAGREKEAADAYRSYVTGNPEDAGALNNLAILDMRSNRWESAEALLRRAVRAKPTANIWVNLGNLHVRKARIEAAEEAYRNAIEMSPAHAAARYNLAAVLEGRGRIAEAVQVIRQAELKDRGQIAHRYRLMARAGGADADAVWKGLAGSKEAEWVAAAAEGFEAAGDLIRARAFFDRAVEMRPGDPALLHNHGAICQKMGELDRAVSDYLEALKSRPEQVSTHYNLALIQEAQGKYANALRSYEAVLRVQPNHRGALNNVAAFYLKIQKPKKAVAILEKVLKTDASFGPAYLNLAWAYLALDWKGKAQEALRTYVGRIPRAQVDPEARRVLEDLERVEKGE